MQDDKLVIAQAKEPFIEYELPAAPWRPAGEPTAPQMMLLKLFHALEWRSVAQVRGSGAMAAALVNHGLLEKRTGNPTTYRQTPAGVERVLQ